MTLEMRAGLDAEDACADDGDGHAVLNQTRMGLMRWKQCGGDIPGHVPKLFGREDIFEGRHVATAGGRGSNDELRVLRRIFQVSSAMAAEPGIAVAGRTEGLEDLLAIGHIRLAGSEGDGLFMGAIEEGGRPSGRDRE